MEMVLLDWTRMGKAFCLAGAVNQGGKLQIVRPLLGSRSSTSPFPMFHAISKWIGLAVEQPPRTDLSGPVRNVGWPAHLLKCRSRWEIFDLIGAEAAEPQPPHREDLWVRTIRPWNRYASLEQRRAILECTTIKPDESLFGAPLMTTRVGAYLVPGAGLRSLATVTVAAKDMSFSFMRREGAPEPDFRVLFSIPTVGKRTLIVKDHHLLAQAERAAADPAGQISFLSRAVKQMGDPVAVRLGLSRAFQGDSEKPAICWLMADGFFSLHDPQP